MLQEVPQQAELGRTEMDFALTAMDTVSGEVQAQVVEAQQLLGERRADPPQYGADPGDQLRGREWLADEVVRTGIEPTQPVRLLATRGQHDDRQVCRLAAATQAAADLEPGELRQHPVE